MATRAPTFRVPRFGTPPDIRASLRERAAEERADYEATRRPIRQYAELIPEGDGRVLDLTPGGFGFQVEPFYSDEIARAPEVVYKKSTQVGATAGMFRWAAREVDQYGRRTVYIFPTDVHVRDFGDERIEPAIDASVYLRDRIPAGYVRNKHLKRIGRGFLFLRGAKSRAGAQSVAGGSLVYDEYDELEPRMIEQFERRLSGAKARGEAPRLRRLGIPTVPGFGIDDLYEHSDQREWHVTCAECGEQQVITWKDNVRWTMPGDKTVYRPGHDLDPLEDREEVGDVWRACAHCDASLEGEPLTSGQWIARNPEARRIGYYIHRLIVPLTDLQELVRNSRKTQTHEIEAFHNNDLGLAYSPAEASLTDADLDAAMGHELAVDVQEHPATRYPKTGGLDAASERNLNLVIHEQLPDGRRRAVVCRELRSFAEAAQWIRAFNVEMLLVDHLPEGRHARELARLFPGRVHPVKYDDNNESDALRFDPKTGKATLNRVEAIDAMMDSIRKLRYFPPRDAPAGYRDQMKAPKRRTEIEAGNVATGKVATGKVKRRYVTPSSKPDDYAMAETYAVGASELWKIKLRLDEERKTRERRMGANELGFRRANLDQMDDTYDPGMGG